MPRWLLIVMAAAAGFVVAAVLGYLLVQSLSSNRHDRAVEAAMTAFFFAGPLGACAAAVLAWFRLRG